MEIFSKKKPSLSEQNISTLIGEDCVINGNINAKDYMRIDGMIHGNVTIEHGLILGEKGVINGDVKTQEIIVYGTVNGDLYSKKLELKSSGKIKGSITTEQAQMDAGAVYNGSMSMHSEDYKVGFSSTKQLDLNKVEQASASASKAS